MKPFKYLTEIVAADVSAIGAQQCNEPMQSDNSAQTSNTIFELFQTAFGANEQAKRGRSWIQLAQIQHGPLLTQETKHFLISILQVDTASVTHTVIEAWLDALRMIVVRSRRNDGTTSLLLEKHYEGLAGTDRDELERDPRSYLSFLNHSNPDRRCAAIIQMVSSGKIGPEQLNHLMRMLKQDDDASVQITATRKLIECCTESFRTDVLAILATVVANESLQLTVRDIAYEGLFELSGAPAWEWPITRSSQGLFVFPDDIDWTLVRTYSRQPL